MTEKSFQDWCIKWARIHGVLVYKVEAIGKRGFPDLVMVAGGRVTFVELKNPNGAGRVSPLQKRTIQELRENGASVYICASREEFETIIAEFAD